MRSRVGYLTGGGLIAVGVVGAVLWFVLSLVNLSNEVDDFQRVPVPGEGTVQLEARKYVIYYEGPNADEVVPRSRSRSRTPKPVFATSNTQRWGSAARGARCSGESPRVQ